MKIVIILKKDPKTTPLKNGSVQKAKTPRTKPQTKAPKLPGEVGTNLQETS